MFENITYVMVKHVDPNILDTPEEWLDSLIPFRFIRYCRLSLSFGGLNVQTEIESEKTSTNL